MTIELRYSWRSRVRICVVALVTFAAGVVAATAGASWSARVVAGVVFVTGAIALVDAIVLTSSWRMTASSLKIPSLANRRREVVGRDDLAVSLVGRRVGAVVVEGERGARRLLVNPLVSPTDLRRWFDAMADA